MHVEIVLNEIAMHDSTAFYLRYHYQLQIYTEPQLRSPTQLDLDSAGEDITLHV